MTHEDRIDDLTLAQKVGQLFQVGFQGTRPSDAVRELIEEYHVGGVIYFSRNVESADQLASVSETLQEWATGATGVPLFLSTDQEGGTVTRIPFGTVPPSQMALGATGDADLAESFGAAVGSQLRALGVNLNLAPVLDVNNNPDNPVIGVRSFGADPDFVGEMGTAVAMGLQSTGVAACGKHFPGHGDTAVDSHRDMPVIDHDRDRLDAVELRPFRAAIEAGVDAVMTAHVNFPAIESDPDVPATLSRRVLTGLLREELGYDGLVVTDCMEMDAIADGVGTVDGAVAAIESGADVVLVSHTADRQRAAIEAVVDAVEAGEIAEERIDRSVRRVLRLKDRRLDPDGTPSFADATDRLVDVADRIAGDAVTLVRDDQGRIPLPDGADVFLWDFGADRSSPAAESTTHVASLADSLADAGHAVRRHTFEDADPDLLPPVEENEYVVACTRDAAHDDDQAAVVRAAVAGDSPVVVLATTNPYDAREVPGASPVLTTYDDSPAMLAAASDVLTGRREPRGVLPVSLE